MARRNETEEERAARKAATKAAKAEKRAECQGLGDPAKGCKPCSLCGRPRDLLIRCQVDATLYWHMACGKCWLEASGGEVDGSASRPYYRYGGLWKNHHKAASGRKKVPAAVKAGPVSGDGSCSGRRRVEREKTRAAAAMIAMREDDKDKGRDETVTEADGSELASKEEGERESERRGEEGAGVAADGRAGGVAGAAEAAAGRGCSDVGPAGPSFSAIRALLLAEAAACQVKDE